MSAIAGIDVGLAALAFSRKILLSLLEDVPEAKLCFQPFPGANHVLWTMGHLAWTDDSFLTGVAGMPSGLPPGFADAFQWGTTPVPDASKYPSLAVIRDQLASRREALTSWLRSLNPTQLASPLPADWGGFAPNFATLPASLAWHEGFHTGQIAVVRKALGFKPKTG